MVLVIERVRRAILEFSGQQCEIGRGIVVFLGIEKNDDEIFLEKVADKILNLRVFDDKEGKLKLSLRDVEGELMLVPNFSLASRIDGNRLSFDKAMPADSARNIYEHLVEIIKKKIHCCVGNFGAFMRIKVELDGPLNVIIRME